MISFNGVKASLISISLFSFSFDKGKGSKKNEIENEKVEIVPEVKQKPKFNDFKTTLYGNQTSFIDQLHDDLIVYIFIQNDQISASWNAVVPVILEKSTGKMYQYSAGTFALEGTGTGSRYSLWLIKALKKHQDKGYKVFVLPKAIDIQLLRDFAYYDSGVKLNDLIDNSIDFINYRKGVLKEIYNTYHEYMVECQLE